MLHYTNKFSPEKKLFYELFLGSKTQKPHFDIDISKDSMDKLHPGGDIVKISDYIKNLVIHCCMQVFQDINSKYGVADKPIVLQFNDLLLYSSHGSSKRSFHLVINNWCHEDNKEAKEFYNLVVSKFRDITKGKYVEFIDSAVYSSKQQFRLLGSQKVGSGRIKIFHEDLSYNGMIHKHIYPKDEREGELKEKANLYESLIGFTSGCKTLPSLVLNKPKKVFTGNSVDFSDAIIDKCMDFIKGQPFSLKSSEGSFITLTRDAPSYCNICRRVHENQDPFIFVVGSTAYFNCRRAKTQGVKDSLYLGSVGKDFITQNIKEISEEKEVFFGFGDFLPANVVSNVNTRINITNDIVPISSVYNNVNASINSNSNLAGQPNKKTYTKKKIDDSEVLKPKRMKMTSLAKSSKLLGDYSFTNDDVKPYDPYDETFYVGDFIRLCERNRDHVFDSFGKLIAFLKVTLSKVVRIILKGQPKLFWKINGVEDLFSLGKIQYTPLPDYLSFKYKTGEIDKDGAAEVEEYACKYALENKHSFLFSEEVINIPYHRDAPHNNVGIKFNVFSGFQAKLVPNYQDCEYDRLYPVLEHIYYVVSDSNMELYWWIISWFAFPIRMLTRTEKILLLIGDPGSGKSIIFEFFAVYVYGHRSSYMGAGLSSVLGQFNLASAKKMFVYVDDTKSVGDKTQTDKFNKFKSMITLPTVTLESKGIDGIPVNNMCNYCITSNYIDPVKLDNGDRRYCISMVNNSRAKDWDYFDRLSALIGTKAIDDTIQKEIGDLMYSYLRSDRIAPHLVKLDRIPSTEIKEDIIETCLPPVEKFKKALQGKEETIPSDILYVRGRPKRPFASTKDLHQVHIHTMKINTTYIQSEGKFSQHFKNGMNGKVTAGKVTIDDIERRGYFFEEPIWDSVLVAVPNPMNNSPKIVTLREWMNKQSQQ